jgi:hypothetical protein
VIIWLNGTFGSGKTTTAGELLSILPDARLFDPETVGYMLMPNLADKPVTDFQHWPPWRPLVVATAVELVRYTGQHLIAPQTVLDKLYLDEIFAGLCARGLDVFLVMLDADEGVLRDRIEGTDEARQWRLDHLDQYRAAREWMIQDADLVVNNATLGPAEVAQLIVNALPDKETRRPREPVCLEPSAIWF